LTNENHSQSNASFNDKKRAIPTESDAVGDQGFGSETWGAGSFKSTHDSKRIINTFPVKGNGHRSRKFLLADRLEKKNPGGYSDSETEYKGKVQNGKIHGGHRGSQNVLRSSNENKSNKGGDGNRESRRGIRTGSEVAFSREKSATEVRHDFVLFDKRSGGHMKVFPDKKDKTFYTNGSNKSSNAPESLLNVNQR
jgi:hypothetical protein